MKQSQIHIILLKNSEAYSILEDNKFRKEWEALYEECPWATPFQDYRFITTWYRIYKDQFNPVILSGTDSDGNLAGLLTLAISNDLRQLVFAGAHQAEYQVWIAKPQHSNSFIENALIKLRAEFLGKSFIFKYIPPLTPMDWTAKNHSLGSYCKIEKRRRPLMTIRDIGNSTINLQTKNVRNYLNKLKRLGEVNFEHVIDRANLELVFDEVISYYDFRQGAINDTTPFHDDSLKKSFHLELMQAKDLLHFSIMKVGNKNISAHLGPCSKNMVYLGVFAYSPFFAKYSPGKLHILLLGEELGKQGYSALDLTPGGDPWKELFATTHEEVYLLTVFSNRTELIRQKIKRNSENFVRSSICLFGIKPKSIKYIFNRARHIKITDLLLKFSRKIWYKSEFRVYMLKSEDAARIEYRPLMKKDCIEDLLSFQPSETWQTRKKFLARSFEYLGKGNHVYTYVEGGVLLHYGWLIEQQEKAFFTEVGQEFEYPSGSAVVFDFYTHPKARGRGLYQSSLRQMLHDAAAIPGIKQIYISVLSDNGPSRHVIEKIGFTYVCSLFQKAMLGIVKKWPSQQVAEL